MDKIVDYVIAEREIGRVFTTRELAKAATDGKAGGAQYRAVEKLAQMGTLFEIGEGLYIYGR